MRQLLFILLLPLLAKAHPGIGIVKDSKGNIFYTDLTHVWKITNGNKMIAVPNVHTHELYIDESDKLYGEGGYYDDRSKKFFHYLWVHHPNGKTDTVVGMKEAYVQQDFTLAKDKKGYGYYLKRFLTPHTDTNHIYKLSPDGKETIFASGNFKHVNWLHPQNDGSLLFTSNNAIYRADSLGNIKLVKEHIAKIKPSFKFSGNSITIWGLWQDKEKNIYAAVFSDQTVKKIDTNGVMTDIYKSSGNWTPLHGVFDNNHQLWVYESSDKNEVRVTLANTALPAINKKTKSNPFVYLIICMVLGLIVFYFKSRNSNASR